jgi:alpha-1,4-digalacturonate transport system substrate-binding protein
MRTKLPPSLLATAAAIVLAGLTTGAASAQTRDIRVQCYSDGNECPVTKDLAAAFMKATPDIKVTVDEVPYSAILQSLPVQLAAGSGPDIARVTLFGNYSKYFLDLRPFLKDAKFWEDNFGPTLDWMRTGADDHGIYGMMTQLTVTAPLVNKTLFEQAKVPVPGDKATWDDWAAAVAKVAKATGTPSGMAWDRSGHRFAGPAISYGAQYFDAAGNPDVVDAGFKAMAKRFYDWNLDGTVQKSTWAGQATGYKDAFDDFANGKIVLYYSGSWQLTRLLKLGNAFDWTIAANPCGPAACSGMPGGAAFVAFKQTKHPHAVAAFLDFMAQPANYKTFSERTNNIPAELPLQKEQLNYDMPAAGKVAIAALLHDAATLSPIAYHLQGYHYSGVIFGATADRIGQAIAGSMTLDQAYERITQDIKTALATAK